MKSLFYENYLIFYFGDFGNEDTAFEWLNKNECYEGQCPKVYLDNKLKSELDITFGEDFWHDAFKTYLMKGYGKTVNSIVKLYDYEEYPIPDDDNDNEDMTWIRGFNN